MKKLFLLFAVAGFVLSSCGNSAQQEEVVVEEQKVEAADSTGCCGSTECSDSTNVQEGETPATEVVE